MKIAFHVMGDASWTFGPVYLRGLFAALRERFDSEVGLYLLAPEGHAEAEQLARTVGADAVVRYATPRPWSAPWAMSRAAQRLLARDPGKAKALERHGVQALFGLQLAFEAKRLATLSLIPDFQHVHLPEMFCPAEREFRERIFRETARRATRVVVFSETVKKDFQGFAPELADKARVLRPISFVPAEIYEQPIAALLAKYHLPEKFVYLPNQFWKHKNHGTAFEAVRILKSRGQEVTLVCSGFPGDYRHPKYFGEVWQKVSEWGLRERVIYLGQIPHDEVLRLMRQSVCVLNPSQFEGWGITVEEARSVGKPVLISDIPAHREQNPPRATWFDPKNAEELAEKMGRIWKDTAPGPDAEMERVARAAQAGRVRKYAEEFAGVAREAAEERE